MTIEFAVYKKRAYDRQTLFVLGILELTAESVTNLWQLTFSFGTLTSKIFAKRLKESLTPCIMHRRAQNSCFSRRTKVGRGSRLLYYSFLHQGVLVQSITFNNKQLIWFKIKLVHTWTIRLVRGAIIA